jgi:limonene-1,2-epoxide hydrolase
MREMHNRQQSAKSDSPIEVVMACVRALNEEDFSEARTYVSDDLSFVGVLGSRSGADAYFTDMERMKLKYDVKNTFANGDDVCLLYDLNIAGKTVFGCGIYHVDQGKITSLKVVFDPRPILDAALARK